VTDLQKAMARFADRLSRWWLLALAILLLSIGAYLTDLSGELPVIHAVPVHDASNDPSAMARHTERRTVCKCHVWQYHKEGCQSTTELQ